MFGALSGCEIYEMIKDGIKRYNQIYIFIAIAVDDTGIPVAVHFSMKNMYLSCVLYRAFGRSNVNASQ